MFGPEVSESFHLDDDDDDLAAISPFQTQSFWGTPGATSPTNKLSDTLSSTTSELNGVLRKLLSQRQNNTLTQSAGKDSVRTLSFRNQSALKLATVGSQRKPAVARVISPPPFDTASASPPPPVLALNHVEITPVQLPPKNPNLEYVSSLLSRGPSLNSEDLKHVVELLQESSTANPPNVELAEMCCQVLRSQQDVEEIRVAGALQIKSAFSIVGYVDLLSDSLEKDVVASRDTIMLQIIDPLVSIQGYLESLLHVKMLRLPILRLLLNVADSSCRYPETSVEVATIVSQCLLESATAFLVRGREVELEMIICSTGVLSRFATTTNMSEDVATNMWRSLSRVIECFPATQMSATATNPSGPSPHHHHHYGLDMLAALTLELLTRCTQGKVSTRVQCVSAVLVACPRARPAVLHTFELLRVKAQEWNREIITCDVVNQIAKIILLHRSDDEIRDSGVGVLESLVLSNPMRWQLCAHVICLEALVMALQSSCTDGPRTICLEALQTLVPGNVLMLQRFGITTAVLHVMTDASSNADVVGLLSVLSRAKDSPHALMVPFIEPLLNCCSRTGSKATQIIWTLYDVVSVLSLQEVPQHLINRIVGTVHDILNSYDVPHSKVAAALCLGACVLSPEQCNDFPLDQRVEAHEHDEPLLLDAYGVWIAASLLLTQDSAKTLFKTKSDWKDSVHYRALVAGARSTRVQEHHRALCETKLKEMTQLVDTWEKIETETLLMKKRASFVKVSTITETPTTAPPPPAPTNVITNNNTSPSETEDLREALFMLFNAMLNSQSQMLIREIHSTEAARRVCVEESQAFEFFRIADFSQRILSTLNDEERSRRLIQEHYASRVIQIGALIKLDKVYVVRFEALGVEQKYHRVALIHMEGHVRSLLAQSYQNEPLPKVFQEHSTQTIAVAEPSAPAAPSEGLFRPHTPSTNTTHNNNKPRQHQLHHVGGRCSPHPPSNAPHAPRQRSPPKQCPRAKAYYDDPLGVRAASPACGTAVNRDRERIRGLLDDQRRCFNEDRAHLLYVIGQKESELNVAREVIEKLGRALQSKMK
eukprot:PhF_6_TR904/c0_g1_i1/m.1462